MPNPEVRYCTTEDGVRIAYCVEGEGPAVIILPGFVDSFVSRLKFASNHEFFDALSGGRTLVHFDSRGVGLSQREVADISLNGLASDVGAVLGSLGESQVSLVATTISGPIALAAAVMYANVVSHLVLCETFANVQDMMTEEQLRSFAQLCRTSWPVAAQAFADMSIRQDYADIAVDAARSFEEGTTGEHMARLIETAIDSDGTSFFQAIRAATLVVHRRGDPAIPFSAAQKMAAGILNARLVPVEGSFAYAMLGDVAALVEPIDAFLPKSESAPPRPPRVDAEDRPEGFRRPGAPVRGTLASVTDIEATFQYALTSEGVSIAHGAAGEGTPLLLLTSPPICHVQLDWESAFRELMLGFAASFHFVWLDWHGAGMSDRETSADFSIEAMLQDVDAVVERVALDRFAIVSQATAVPIAITYAARHPERVTHLVLADGFAEPEDWRSAPWATMATAIQGQDWALYTETMARVFIGEHVPADRAGLASFAAYIRACVDQPTMLALSDAFAHYRVSSLLPELAVPTLVLATGHGMVAPETASQRIAASIPGAQYRKIGHSAAELHAAVGEFVLGKQFAARGLHSTMAAPAVAPQSFASGRYVVSRLLGEGGQKTVFLARDTQLDRDVAVALLKPEGIDAAGLARLQREARSLARLEAQPHIVAIYDIGEHERRPYTVCEYLAGGSLEEELARAAGPLAVERAVAIAQDICRALIVAHGSDIIHRDIKPSNVWLTASGSAKLGDFGLATALGRSHFTQAGTVMGTAAYMAPEQALGREADQRSDIYALGCVLYEMFAGRPPFTGDGTVAVVYQHVEAAPAALSALLPGLAPALERIVLQMLAKPPEDRPQTAADVLAALEGNAPSTSAAPARARSPVVTEPQVRYCTTEDGVRIAYTVTGSGPPLLLMLDRFLSNVQLEWSHPIFPRVYGPFIRDHTLIRFDPRGSGLSDRVFPATLEDTRLDIEAVVDRLQLRDFTLAGIQTASLGSCRTPRVTLPRCDASSSSTASSGPAISSVLRRRARCSARWQTTSIWQPR